MFLVLPGPVEGTATDGRFRYGRYSFTLDSVPYGGESWGGRESGARDGRRRAAGPRAVQGTPRHTDLHFDPQATTFLSPPGGIYLILRNVLL